LIRHAPGHATHLHVRFYSPRAQESGRRLYSSLARKGLLRPAVSFVRHRVRRGQTLIRLARRYRTTPKAIRRANGLRSNLIRVGRVYKIPRRGGVPRPPAGPIVVPPRRLPPEGTKAPSCERRQARNQAEAKGRHRLRAGTNNNQKNRARRGATTNRNRHLSP
jgi:LysM repeat protein